MRRLITFSLILISCTQAPLKDTPPLPLATLNTVPRFPAQSPRDLEQRQQCARDLCGNPKENLPKWGRGAFTEIMPSNVQEYITNTVNPKLSEIFEATTQDAKTRVELMDTWMQLAAADSFTDEQTAYLVIYGLLKKIQPSLDSSVMMVNPEVGNYHIDFEKLQNRIKDIDPAFLKKIVPIINAFYDSPETRSNYLYQLPYDIYLDSFIPSQLRARYASSILTQVQLLQKKIGSLVVSDLNVSTLYKVISEKELNSIEKPEFMSLLERFYYLRAITSGPIITVTRSQKIQTAELLANLGWSGSKNSIVAFTNSEMNRLLAKQRALNYCQWAIAPAIAASPSNLRQRKAIELGKAVKQAAKKAAQAYFSDVALERALEAIETAKYVSPRGIETARADIVNKIDSSLALVKANQSSALAAKSSGADWKSVFLDTISRYGNGSKFMLEDQFQNLCDEIRPKTYEDASYLKLGRIQMGWQTVLYPAMGAGVMAHELGHLVSEKAGMIDGSEVFREARACSNTLHANLGDAHFKRYQYAEEDGADLFAATTLRELQKTWPHAENYGCSRMQPSASGDQFSNLNLFENQGGVHSNPFLRTLNLHLNLGRSLPPSCLSALKKEETDALLKKCGK